MLHGPHSHQHPGQLHTGAAAQAALLESSRLNPAQLQAVTHKDGPVVIYAGAGSGKTRVICYRIAHLISLGVPSAAIIAVTFTNKAAREMKERIESIIGPRSRSMVVSTFHSACARFLRIYAREIGFTEAFSIYDDDDQKSLLKDVVKDLNIPDKFLSVATIKNKIDRLKNQGETPESFRQRLAADATIDDQRAQIAMRRYGEEEHAEIIQKCYALYQARLKQQNAMDFNDLLLLAVELLENHPVAREQLQNRFRYFLVDEFQDTNPIQFKFVKLLSDHTRNLCIVGDDDQSIYSWRGAEPSFILDFRKYYADAIVYKLEQNYRSSETIVRAATGLISHNLKRAPKTLWTQQSQGELIVLKSAIDAYEEAQFVCTSILTDIEKGARYSDFAILYRTNAQSRALEDELRRRMLPYIIYGSVRFYERAEIKSLLAYLRLLVNPDDDAAFVKVIGTPKRGFGDKALAGLRVIAQTKTDGLSLLRTTHRMARNDLTGDVGRGLPALKELSRLFLHLQELLESTKKPSLALSELVSAIRFEDYLRSHYPEEFDDRWLNVLELKNALVEFEDKFAKRHTEEIPQTADFMGERQGEQQAEQQSEQQGEPRRGEGWLESENPNVLAAFLEQAALTVEPTVHNVQSGEASAISLMTIHASKGLEFDRVFIAGLEEGVLPHTNSLESDAAIEEERRLLYVAITRARQTLRLSHIQRNRFRSDFPAEPSRFLSEIPHECLQVLRSEGRRSSSYGSGSGYGSNTGATKSGSNGARSANHQPAAARTWSSYGSGASSSTSGQASTRSSEQNNDVFLDPVYEEPRLERKPNLAFGVSPASAGSSTKSTGFGGRMGGKPGMSQQAHDPLADPVYDDAEFDAPPVWQKGLHVQHKLFGVGIIQSVEKSLDGYRLEIRFPIVGVKKIMHTFVTPV